MFDKKVMEKDSLADLEVDVQITLKCLCSVYCFDGAD